MSALSRIRTLAAALALLLFMSANAIAWTNKPMDTPGGPPVPNPQEVGDPDFGNGLTWKRYVELFRATFVGSPLLRRIALPTQSRVGARSVFSYPRSGRR